MRRGRWPLAAAALTVAVLARETSLLVVAGLGAGAAWDAWRARQEHRPMPLLAVGLAVSVRRWINDVQFPRATYESWALSVLVLVSSTDRRARLGLAGAGSVTLGVAAMYVALV